MIFCQTDKNHKVVLEKLSNVVFFTFYGGALGVVIGGSVGLFKGVPLRRILPSSMFRSSAFFGTITAIQSALELTRNEKDAWNPLIAGGWTGFIFARNIRIGLGVGLNGALMNWGIQAFTLPKSLDISFEPLNPILREEQSAPLQKRIDALKAEISAIKNK